MSKLLGIKELCELVQNIKTRLNGKVDKVAGKGLSTNDYTTAEKNKLAGIQAGAEVNVQSDWNQTNTSADDFIKNKPTIPTRLSQLTNDGDFVEDPDYVHTDNNFTTAEKNKLSGIAAGAQPNVQANWTETSTSSDAYIRNKPTIPTATSDLTNDSNFVSDANYVHTDNNFTTTLKNKLDGVASGAEVNVQSDWNQSTTTADDYIKNKPSVYTKTEGDNRYVKQTGDTMTGALTQSVSSAANRFIVKNTNIDRQVSTGAYQESGHVAFMDKSDASMGYINGYVDASGNSGIRLLGWRSVNGTNYYNGLSLGVKPDGSAHVFLSANATNAAAAWRSAIGTINRAGDTMTANFTLSASDTTGRWWKVKNSNHEGSLYVDPSGNLGVWSDTKGKWIIRSDTSGNVYVNGLNFTSAATARSAIGAVNKAGDTMTGGLTLQYGVPQYDIKATGVNLKATNNGSSSSQRPGYVIHDNNGLNVGQFITLTSSSGNVQTEMLAYNYNTSGTSVGTNYIQCNVTKNGAQTYAVANQANFRSAIGAAAASSSSKRYKHDIADIQDEELDPHKLYDLPVKQFVFNDDHDLQYADMKGKTIPGFIAEDVAEIYPSAVIHDEDGRVESWDERRIIPAMLKLIQEQHEEIERLKQLIASA